MHSVPLGATGTTVSAACLGTDYFGTLIPRTTAFQLLDQFADAGGTFVDTSNVYACWVPGFFGGESESVIGAWMESRRKRDQMFLGTKVGFPYRGSGGGLSQTEVERECDKSLRRLNTDRIDLYYAHCDDRTTPLDDIVEAFDRLVRSGKVRFVGASNWHTWRLAEARNLSELKGWASHTAVQLRHTYLRHRAGTDFLPHVAVDSQLQDFCQHHTVSILAYSILLSGAYTRADRVVPPQYLGADSQARLAVLRDVAEELAVTPNQVVIAWMAQDRPQVIPIIGAETPDQLRENLDGLAVRLPDEVMGRLQRAGM